MSQEKKLSKIFIIYAIFSFNLDFSYFQKKSSSESQELKNILHMYHMSLLKFQKIAYFQNLKNIQFEIYIKSQKVNFQNIQLGF